MTNKIRIHISFWPVAFYFFLSGGFKRFLAAAILVFMHEIGHIIAALSFGLKLEEVLVMPIGQRAVVRDIYMASRIKRIAIFMSGPMLSILTGVILYVIGEGIYGDISLALGIFNLLPILPLDGGNITMSALGAYMGDINSAKAMLRFSKFISKMMIVLGIARIILYPYNLDLIVAGLFMIMINRASSAGIYNKIFSCLKNSNIKKPQKVNCFYISGDIRIYDILGSMRTDRSNIYITDDSVTFLSQKDICDMI